MVIVTNDFPKRLVMETDTPYKAYSALKTKYFVAKNRQDFTKFDHQWNQFKITDTKADPDKIFATLEEHSKKLEEFGARYEKDALQMISKLEVALPDEYKHIFTLLNTESDHKKSADIQLTMAKRMIKAHYEIELTSDTIGKDNSNSMMCMFVGENNAAKRTTTYKCDHCEKNGHTA